MIKKDDLIVCEDCGCKYPLDEAKNLLTESNNETPEIISSTKPQEKHNGSSGCLGALISVVAITLGITLCIFAFYHENADKLGDKPIKQQIIEIVKEKPNVSYEETISGLEFYIHCNDNYSYVELELYFYDKNGNVVQTKTLTGNNYKKGYTYTLSYTPANLSELWNLLKAGTFSYKIVKYE